MEKSLLQELKELLDLIESFKSEISQISAQKAGFKAINHHIDIAILESEEATKKIIDFIGSSLEAVQESLELISQIKVKEDSTEKAKRLRELLSATTSSLINALTLLEFQDILAQRLLKVKNFLSDIEKSILKIAILAGIEETDKKKRGELEKKLEELEWKKEISQNEVDEIMKQFGL
ncbi:putative myosin-2 heavy chain, non muscle [Desulfurobacterium thermolithotrophum DSM 11699]|uniref:Putative myosin-2 heavy chain, non muscle n=1 Tax=Desulfurobacterium thermolithotrophum (strain DSM 11699 / BSA) TaxID=868864 RepID=F0S0I1_DESTD|nr:hypothetical protein [Desulfurobacterium thermolithotrophum]ADY72709.1 putative myosin-2 heavy chain, non muscle [Desulfurobacterium thermolithotrophum DSM 11699]